MEESIESKVLIREYKEDRDFEMVGKLEKKCETAGSKKGVSMFTNMIGDPLCRIRFYPVHVMLVAELLENGDLVGVIRGCIKEVGTKFGGAYVKLGCILGLRVSPTHRRMGIGLKLVKAVEEWLIRNGAQYTFLATEENNVASTNLFTLKCNYLNFTSLVIFFQPLYNIPAKDPSDEATKIDKLNMDQAISLYTDRFTRNKEVCPRDMDMILKEKQSFGTWVCYLKEEEWVISKTPSSWIIFSIWNSSKIRKTRPFSKFFRATTEFFPCLGKKQKTFGFLFLYGVYGEGERVGEMMKSVWRFAARFGERVKDCEVVMTEMGISDPLIEHVPKESSVSCINDVWYLKKVSGRTDDNEESSVGMGAVGNVFVDPRDI